MNYKKDTTLGQTKEFDAQIHLLDIPNEIKVDMSAVIFGRTIFWVWTKFMSITVALNSGALVARQDWAAVPIQAALPLVPVEQPTNQCSFHPPEILGPPICIIP